MKSFFKIFGCILGFAVLVTLCYFFVNPKDERNFAGKYCLYKTVSTDISDEDNPIETETEIAIDEDKYLELKRDRSINAVNISELEFIEGKEYTYFIEGTKFEIKQAVKVVYSGAFAENEIVIAVLDEDNDMTYEYYYKKVA